MDKEKRILSIKKRILDVPKKEIDTANTKNNIRLKRQISLKQKFDHGITDKVQMNKLIDQYQFLSDVYDKHIKTQPLTINRRTLHFLKDILFIINGMIKKYRDFTSIMNDTLKVFKLIDKFIDYIIDMTFDDDLYIMNKPTVSFTYKLLYEILDYFVIGEDMEMISPEIYDRFKQKFHMFPSGDVSIDTIDTLLLMKDYKVLYVGDTLPVDKKYEDCQVMVKYGSSDYIMLPYNRYQLLSAIRHIKYCTTARMYMRYSNYLQYADDDRYDGVTYFDERCDRGMKNVSDIMRWVKESIIMYTAYTELGNIKLVASMDDEVVTYEIHNIEVFMEPRLDGNVMTETFVTLDEFIHRFVPSL